MASTLIFGARALLVTGVTVAACVGFEALYCVVMKKPVPVGDFSAVVTGMILAFNLPATIPLWIAIIGAFVAIVVAKQLFGGLGFNFANPALLGRIVLFIGFAGRMTAYAFPQTDIDALASATPLVAGNSMAGKDMLLQLLLGAHGGVLGETCAVALILGGIYLIATKTISAAIPLSYIGTVAVLSLVLGQDVVLQLLFRRAFAGRVLHGDGLRHQPVHLHGPYRLRRMPGRHHLHHPVLRQHGRRCQLCVAADEPAGALYQ